VPAIRPADPEELEQLVAVEAAADRLFATVGFDLYPGPGTIDGLRRARAVLVAGRPPVGFAAVDEVDGSAHLEQLAVHPDHGRRGIGRALLEAACHWASRAGYPTMTLVTFTDVAWNGPFYVRSGFVPLVELGPGLAELRALDRANGLEDLGCRQVMVRHLGPAGRRLQASSG
jgi:GNAT superfamily N-acetyltransferase